MRYLPALAAILVFQFSALAQHILGFKADGGLSQIVATTNDSLSVHRNAFSFSGQEGMYYNFHLRRKALLGAELLFVQIRGNEHSEIYGSGQQGNLSGSYFIQDYRRTIYYFGLPVYYGFRYKKLNVNLGFQVLLTMKSKGHIMGTSGYNSVSSDYESRISKLDILGYSLGPRAGMMFTLTKKISIEAVYYLGINNVLVNDASVPAKWKEWRVHQLAIGIRYKVHEFEYEGKKINAVLD